VAAGMGEDSLADEAVLGAGCCGVVAVPPPARVACSEPTSLVGALSRPDEEAEAREGPSAGCLSSVESKRAPLSSAAGGTEGIASG